MKRPVAIVNGQSADAMTVDSRGLNYGDGVFETFPAVRAAPLLWLRHWARLQSGCQVLGLTPPPIAEVEAAIKTLTAHLSTAVVKLLVVRAATARGYRPGTSDADWIARAWPWHPSEVEQQEGVDVVWCQLRLAAPSVLAGVKSLNRLEQVLAQREWQAPVREGLMQDAAGFVIEGTMSNVFISENGRLVTPDLSGCGIAGVMRAAVIEVAQREGIAVAIEPLPRARIERADELFLTNSLIGIWPIKDLGGHSYGVGPMSRRLLAILKGEGHVACN